MRGFLRRAVGGVLALGLLVCALPFAAHAQGAGEPLPEVGAESYVVMDASSGQVLMGAAADQRMYPASITKIVTLALVQQALNEGSITLDTQTTVSDYAVNSLIHGAATIQLVPGEVVSVRDMMYATQIRSANDAANVLAELVGGSAEGFAAMMNAQVASLGLVGTHFTNPHGLPEEDHYTTAYDMGVLTVWAMGVPGFADWFNVLSYVMGETNLFEEERGMSTQNYMQWPESRWYYEGIVGAKSGYTADAGYTLVTAAERGDTTLICVVLRCELNDQKYIDTAALLDYGFNHFSRVSIAAGPLSRTTVPAYGGGEQPLGDITVYPVQGEVSFLLMDRLSLDDVSAEYEVPERYVMGTGFAPALVLRVPNSAGQYERILAVPLEFEGIEGVLASNTTATAGAGAKDGGVLGVILLSALLTFVALVAGRILYVRKRRAARKRRLQQRQRSAARGRTVQLDVYRAQPRRAQR